MPGDLAHPSQHPLAKVAKDVAAGTVLICAVASVIVGCIIFLPHLVPLLTKLTDCHVATCQTGPLSGPLP